MPKTIVYIDGFNLYYALLRRSPYKWLDLVSLFTDHVRFNERMSLGQATQSSAFSGITNAKQNSVNGDSEAY